MLALPEKSLSEATQKKLEATQKEIDNQQTFAEQVAKGKAFWGSRTSNNAFKEIRETLAEMSPGTIRCTYCEDTLADEIEHIYPKDWFPELCFVWKNYCYACGPCNGPKNNKFAIFKPGENTLFHLERGHKDPVLPPPKGKAALVNPREEDPMEYLFLDLESFAFTPWPDPEEDAIAYNKALYTRDVLELNKRADLIRQREKAYGNYRARLREYWFQKKNGANAVELAKLQTQLSEEGHRTVWLEIKRQYVKSPSVAKDFKELFEEIPEALAW